LNSKKADLIKELFKASKFAIVGVANTVIDYAVFLLLAKVMNINVYAAQVAGYSVGMLNSYYWNRKWTFKAKDKFLSPALVKFVILNICMLGLSTLLLFLFYEKLEFAEEIAKLFATAVTMAVSFLINRLWVFKENTASSENG